MSDLKYKTFPELRQEERDCQRYINNLKKHLSGQQEKLKWIKKKHKQTI